MTAQTPATGAEPSGQTALVTMGARRPGAETTPVLTIDQPTASVLTVAEKVSDVESPGARKAMAHTMPPSAGRFTRGLVGKPIRVTPGGRLSVTEIFHAEIAPVLIICNW